MSKPWPPPPDLDSLKELFATADIEGFIADDCPIDEYDPEAKHFYEATRNQPTAMFVKAHTLPILQAMWTRQFMLNESQLADRQPALLTLAQQIERFFGPEAKPQVRN